MVKAIAQKDEERVSQIVGYLKKEELEIPKQLEKKASEMLEKANE